jgi:hypothetical protein
MSEGNGCAHVNTTARREGDDSVIRCDACGDERSRVKDAYKDE